MNNSSSRIFFGVCVIFVGFVFLFEQLGISNGIARLWPLIIVATGVYMVMHNFRNVMPGLIVLALGIFLLMDSLKVLPFPVWNLWPLFIVFAGISILMGKKDRWSTSTIVDSKDSNFITANATFWGSEKIVRGEFKGADLNAVFGAIKLDLREAKLQDKTTININLVFAGLELLLPDNVHVINKTEGVIGGVSDKSKRTPDSTTTKTIEITGSAVFGGVDIK